MAAPRLDGATPIEWAIAAAIERELREAARSRPPRSTHPVAIAAQDRRRIATQARLTRERREAMRRRAHRLVLEAALRGQEEA